MLNLVWLVILKKFKIKVFARFDFLKGSLRNDHKDLKFIKKPIMILKKLKH